MPAKNLSRLVTVARLERNLDAVCILHARDRDDGVFSPIHDGKNGDIDCWLLVEGKDRTILRLVAKREEQTIPQQEWARTLQFINRFHQYHRFGRGILEYEEGEAEGVLYFTAALDVSEGMGDGLLQTWCCSHMATAAVFFDQARKELGLLVEQPGKRGKANGKGGELQLPSPDKDSLEELGNG